MAKPKITEMFLTPNKYSRPQIKLEKVKKIAAHYVGNPNTSALANRNYFEGLKDQIPDKTGKYCIKPDGSYLMYNGSKVKIRSVSAHFLIGLDGEIIQCIPLDEWSYCTNQANGYSISIECCHPDATGKFTAATEKSLAELCAWLVEKYGLAVDDIIRHYDVTGKQCPLYYVPTKYQTKAAANKRWNDFKALVKSNLIKDYNDKSKNEDIHIEKPVFNEYTVKILCDKLNVRKAPGLNNEVVMTVPKGYKYTIVAEQYVGNVPWGKLKSGVGWISLLPAYVQKC